MAPLIPLDWITNIVEETGLEYLTNGQEIKNAWEMISQRFCEERGLEPLNYKVFSNRWKNATFYMKRTAKKEQYKRDGGSDPLEYDDEE